MDFILILLAGLGGNIFYYSNGYQQVFFIYMAKQLHQDANVLDKHFNDPMLELQLSFYTATLPIFTH